MRRWLTKLLRPPRSAWKGGSVPKVKRSRRAQAAPRKQPAVPRLVRPPAWNVVTPAHFSADAAAAGVPFDPAARAESLRLEAEASMPLEPEYAHEPPVRADREDDPELTALRQRRELLTSLRQRHERLRLDAVESEE